MNYTQTLFFCTPYRSIYTSSPARYLARAVTENVNYVSRPIYLLAHLPSRLLYQLFYCNLPHFRTDYFLAFRRKNERTSVCNYRVALAPRIIADYRLIVRINWRRIVVAKRSIEKKKKISADAKHSLRIISRFWKISEISTSSYISSAVINGLYSRPWTVFIRRIRRVDTGYPFESQSEIFRPFAKKLRENKMAKDTFLGQGWLLPTSAYAIWGRSRAPRCPESRRAFGGYLWLAWNKKISLRLPRTFSNGSARMAVSTSFQTEDTTFCLIRRNGTQGGEIDKKEQTAPSDLQKLNFSAGWPRFIIKWRIDTKVSDRQIGPGCRW